MNTLAGPGCPGAPSLEAREVPDLLDALPVGVVRVSDGRLAEANRAFERIAGRPFAEIRGRWLCDLLCDARGRPVVGDGSSDAVRLRMPDGSLRDVSVASVSPSLLIVQDRSRESRLESEIWKLGRGHAVGMGGEAPPSPLQSEVAAMIEHEIGTAITVIRGYLRMLLVSGEASLPADLRAYTAGALDATQSLAGLVANLLELARTGEGGLRVVRKPLDLRHCIEEASRMAQPLLVPRSHRLCVEIEVDGDGCAISGDSERLVQVLLNLLSNAAKFAPEGSEIAVSAGTVELARAPFVVVTVADRGPGVGREDAERIFGPFVRGPHAAQGAGLGLAVARAIVEAHGGRIEAVPELGYGLFRVLLPVDASLVEGEE